VTVDGERRSALTALGARVGRDTALFTVGSAAGLALGLISAIVLTHFMTPAEYGRMAVMVVTASLLTTLYNLGSLQGTLITVFGSSGEEESVADDEEMDRGDPRGTLTAGLALTIAVSAIATLVLTAAAGPLSHLVSGRRDATTEFALAATSGGLGAVWRLAVNVLRLERRAMSFVAMQLLRPIAVLGISIPLLVEAGTAERALAGLVLGTGVGLAATMLVSARSYAPRLVPEMVPRILKRGAPYIAISLSFWIVHTVDTYIVSAFASDARTGEYRLASRLGAFTSYFTSAFLMAWSPMTRTAAYAAADRRDSPGTRRLLANYFVLAVTWLVLAVALTADLLVRVAPAAYSAAAPIVPLVALGWGVYAVFVTVYRASEFEGKRRVYVILAVTAAATFLVSGVGLTSALGPPGAALANVVAFGLVTIILLLKLRARGVAVPLDARRLVPAVLLAGLCYGVGLEGGRLSGEAQPLVIAAAVAAFPALLVLARIVPPAHVAGLRAVGTAALRPRAGVAAVRERLEQLDDEERRLLESAAWGPDALREHAVARSLSEPELALRLVGALRTVGDPTGPSSDDLLLGRYLLARGAVAERDVLARDLWKHGVDPLDLHNLEATLVDVRGAVRARRRA
jgi:O-antigen/teichoic acid export membrane protein